MEALPGKQFQRYFDPPCASSQTLPLIRRSETGSPLTQALAEYWLDKCRTNVDDKHDECNNRQVEYLPSRLLDVNNALSTGLLLLVSVESSSLKPFTYRDYITLSHCWGKIGSRNKPILTTSNLKQRQQHGILLNELPRTFQHAITIASWLQVRWLWIDCLCIVQDSTSDWIREASLMSETYQNAYLNISADFGSDSDAGCFVDRDITSITTPMLDAPLLNEKFFLVWKPAYYFMWMTEATSLSRAWISRERQLSKRILHFTHKELVWECCGTDGTGFASETFPKGAPFIRTFNQDNKYQTEKQDHARKDIANSESAVWNDVCESLSKKGPTKQSDMPAILSGLSKELVRKLPTDEYVAGLWRSTLPYGLLWHTLQWKAESSEYIAPSWSWLSVSCGIKMANRAQVLTQYTLARVVDIFMDFQYDPPFGPLTSASIVLSGIVRRIRISFQASTPIFNLSLFDDDERGAEPQLLGPSSDDYEGELCNLELDEVPRSAQVEFYCLLITMKGSVANRREIECLLLQPTGKSKRFQRCGTLVLGDPYSLRMRYKLDRAQHKAQLPSIKEDKLWFALTTLIKNAHKEEGERPEQKASVTETPNSAVNDEDAQLIDLLYHFDQPIAGYNPILDKLMPQTVTIY